MKFVSRRALKALFGALSLALLASCGGGDFVDPFKPRRLVAFGDETTALTTEGKKYTINPVIAGDVTCSTNPNWAQYVAKAFNLPFPCSAADTTAPSVDRAAFGAKVADVGTQVDQHLAGDRFNETDLVLVLAGGNDILEEFARIDDPGQSEAAIGLVLEQRGLALALQVNRIATAGGRVVVSTVPDLGLTPFALGLAAGRADVLSRLTDRFNLKMRSSLINDGRLIGLILADSLTRSIERDPGARGFANITQKACTTATRDQTKDCTTATLVSGASATSWLWADDIQLSPGGHRYLGLLAEDRARNNPF